MNRPDPGPAIEARGLTRYFGGRCAVDGVSFRVPRGSAFAFIGRNGAGKTTTIRMILGLLESLGALAVDEQSVGLEEALIAYVGRHGRKSHLLKHLGGLK